MRSFITHLTERSYQNRTVAFVENGSWAPTAKRTMAALLEKSKNITYCENSVTIKSSLNADSKAALEALADEICRK